MPKVNALRLFTILSTVAAVRPAVAAVRSEQVPAQTTISTGPVMQLFHDDWSSTSLGQFPSKLRRIDGDMAVADKEGRRFLKVSTSSTFEAPLLGQVPDAYRVEFDMLVPSSTGYAVEVRPEPAGAPAGYARLRRRQANPVAHCGAISSGIYGASSEGSQLTRFPDSLAKQVTSCRIEVTPAGVKVYFAGQLAGDAPGASMGSGTVIAFHVPAGPRQEAWIGPISVRSQSQRVTPLTAGVPRAGGPGGPRPEGVTARQEGNTSVRVGWNCVEGAESYEVHASIGSAAPQKIGTAGSACMTGGPSMQGYEKPAALDPNAPQSRPRNSVLHENVAVGSTMTYVVRAIFEGGFSESSPVSETITAKLAAPAKLTARLDGLQLVRLTWEPVPGAQGHTVKRTTGSGGGDLKQLTAAGCHTEASFDEIQTLAGTYTYFVSACPNGPPANAGITVPPFPNPVAIKKGPSASHPGYAVFDGGCLPCHTNGLSRIDFGWCHDLPTNYDKACEPEKWSHLNSHMFARLLSEREMAREGEMPVFIGGYGQSGLPDTAGTLSWTGWMEKSVSSSTKVMGRPLLCCRPSHMKRGADGSNTRLLTQAEIKAVVAYVLDEQVLKRTGHEASQAKPQMVAFEKNCTTCHSAASFSGKRFSHWQVRNVIVEGRVGPTPRPFGTPKGCPPPATLGQEQRYEEYKRLCVEGRRHMGLQPVTSMPAFKGKFSDGELVDLTEYVVRLSRQ